MIESGRCGIIDTSGRILTPLIYDTILSNGVAILDGRRGMLDKDGRVVVDLVFEWFLKLGPNGKIDRDICGDLVIAAKKD